MDPVDLPNGEPDLAAEYRADLQALADVRTLDGWALSAPEQWWTCENWDRGQCAVLVCLHVPNNIEPSDTFGGSTADEARSKAAAWVRGMK